MRKQLARLDVLKKNPLFSLRPLFALDEVGHDYFTSERSVIRRLKLMWQIRAVKESHLICVEGKMQILLDLNLFHGTWSTK